MNRRELGKALASTALLGVGGERPLCALAAEAGAKERSSAWQQIAPGIWRATVGTPEVHTPIRARRFPPASAALERMPKVEAPPLHAPAGELTHRGVELSLDLRPKELMYGFGLQMTSFQQRGKKRTLRVNADPKGDSGDSHAPVPFYVSTLGYGVLVDTLRHVVFYCGEAHPRPEQPVPADSVQVNTPQMMRVRGMERPAKVLVEVPRSTGVDIYLFAGPALRQAVQRYVLFSGGGVQPPEWGLGFWYRPEMHMGAEEVLSLGRELRARDIPCDVLGLEPGWQTHAYSCTFAWDRSRFPDPKSFVDAAAKLGYRINLWEHAFTHPASPLFPPLLPFSGDYGVWGGLVPDFAGEQARRIFGEYHGHALIDLGVSGFKLDECDNSDFTEGWSFPDNSHFPSGVDGEQMHAEFGLRYQDAVLRPFLERGRSTYSLARSSGALSAPYPFVLYSDLYDHRVFVRALVNAGFSGLLWCPEVRDAISEEDLIRRLQTAVFSPLAMINAWYIRNPPWKQIDREKNNAGEFGRDWQTLEARCREILGWRMQLLPYLLSAFATYERGGIPPFRALIMDWPDDPALVDVDDQYLIGDRMLVAPLFAGEAERTIVLPAGNWHDLWTGARFSGGKIHSVAASTERIPVYVKSGTLLPWAEVSSHTGAGEKRRFEVRVFGDGHLPWDAPESLGSVRFEWDAEQQRGRTSSDPGTDSPFTITEWRPIG